MGEFETAGVLLTHVWPGQKPQRTWRHDQDGPASRHAFVVVFDTSAYVMDPPLIIPDFSETGGMICDLFSVLFGKRFDICGSVEEVSLFCLPDLSVFDLSLNPNLPFHSQNSRIDFGAKLDFSEVRRLKILMFDPNIDASIRNIFQKACKAYRLALLAAEKDSEISYVRLINSVEVIASSLNFGSDDLLDDERRELLARLCSISSDQKLISFVRQSLRQVKRKFVRTVRIFANESLFQNVESKNSFKRFSEDNLDTAMSAAYDIRSRYVHDGLEFGGWLGPSGYQNLEFMLGGAVGQNDSLTKLLSKAPTLVGLERVVRSTLLQFAISRELIAPTLGEQ